MTAKEMIVKARTLLLLDHSFWGCLAMRLRFQEDDSIETACTNGVHIKYNSKFIEEMSNPEIQFVEAHEVCHVALGHIWRKGDRNPQIWNVACDYVVNKILVDAGMTMPSVGLLDTTGKFDGKSVEEIYNIIYQEQPKGGGLSKEGDDPGRCGGMEEIPDTPQGKKEGRQLEAEWKAALAQAAQMCRGDVPSNMKRLIEEVLDPPLPWYTLLRDFVERTARNDYSWSKPNPRYFSTGIILPSLISEEIPEIDMAIDSSGSITQQLFNKFSPNASDVLAAYNTLLRVFSCDAEIQSEQEFRREDLPITLELKGGGSTDFRPVFEKIATEGYSPSCLIYLTDLYGRFPDKEPDYPVLWISTTKDSQAPFGTTIYFNEK